MSHPVPYELAKLRGFPGKQRSLPPGPQPARSEQVPEPLPFLSEFARAEWRRVAPELHRLRLLTVLDHAVLAAYCASYARWVEAERMLESEGLVAPGSNGDNLVQHPAARIASQAARDLCKFAVEFGMTPCARARLRTGGDSGPGKFDGLLA